MGLSDGRALEFIASEGAKHSNNESGLQGVVTARQPSPSRKPTWEVRIMAKRQFTFAGLTAAVAYLRMSDKKQDKSIPAQKAEIEKYAAAHGYQIVRWYRDEGISGAEGRKRAGFQQ